MQERPRLLRVRPVQQVAQLPPLAGRQRPLEGDDRVPAAVLQHHPNEEDRQLEPRIGDHERLGADRRVEVGLLDRQVVGLGHVVAHHEAVVRVDVHERARRLVQGVRVPDAGELLPPRQPGILEPEPSQDLLEPRCVRPAHQEIEIVLAGGRPRQGLVALPVAVANPSLVEGAAQPGDQLERRAPVSVGLARPRAGRDLGPRPTHAGHHGGLRRSGVRHRGAPAALEVIRIAVGQRCPRGRAGRATSSPDVVDLRCDTPVRHACGDVCRLRRTHDPGPRPLPGGPGRGPPIHRDARRGIDVPSSRPGGRCGRGRWSPRPTRPGSPSRSRALRPPGANGHPAWRGCSGCASAPSGD